VDFDLREWLLILGPVFVIGVAIHGYWRMRRGRSDLKMALDKSFLTPPGEGTETNDLSQFKAELPNGGARVIKLNLEEDVPVLMDSLDIQPVEKKREVASPAVEKSPPARKRAAIQRPEKFVVVNVVANDHIDGQVLLEAIVELDMIYGEMDIFHRFGENGQIEFSLANSVEPGTFVLAEMGNLQTAGVVLFMRVHEVTDPVEVYDSMMDVAQKLCDEFVCDLQDESRSTMTSQTIEHCRQGIQDFQFKYSA